MKPVILLPFVVAVAAAHFFGLNNVTVSPSDGVSVDGWSTVTPSLSPLTGVASVTATPTASADTILSIFSFITTNANGSVQVQTSTVTNHTPDAISSNGVNRHNGALAGGVVAAIVVATVGALLYGRYRAKRSSRHWRNRIGTQGRWQNLDRKTALHAAVPINVPVSHTDPATPFAYPPTPTTATPLTPLFIRDKHRPAINDPFTDPYVLLERESSLRHGRKQSSFGSLSGDYHRREGIC